MKLPIEVIKELRPAWSDVMCGRYLVSSTNYLKYRDDERTIRQIRNKLKPDVQPRESSI